MGIFAQQQIKHLKGWALGKKSGDDFIERTKNNLPSLWDGELDQSFCAKGDGATGYIDHGLVNVCGAGASSLIYYAKICKNPTANGTFISEYLTTGNARGWFFTYVFSGNRINCGIAKSDGTLFDTLEVAGIGLADNKELRVELNADGLNLVMEVFVDDVSQGTDTAIGQNKIYSNGAKLITFATNNGGGGQSDAGICDEKLTVDGVVKLNCPFQGSTLDISGNDYHGVISGTVDLYETQRFFHYNIMYGFDDYTDDATGLIHIYVPYVDGSPVVASITDYTKQTSNPAGIYHNGAETKVVPFTSSHDGTGWVVPASIKSIDTDELLHNAVTGYAIPLDYAALATLDAANSAYVFVDTDIARQRKNLMLYTEELTGVELTKARAFVNH